MKTRFQKVTEDLECSMYSKYKIRHQDMFEYREKLERWVQVTTLPKPGQSYREVVWRGRSYFVDGQSLINESVLMTTYFHFSRFGSMRCLAVKLGVKVRTLRHWKARYVCFRDAIDLGEGAALEWFETACFYIAAGIEEKNFKESYGFNLPTEKEIMFLYRCNKKLIDKFC